VSRRFRLSAFLQFSCTVIDTLLSATLGYWQWWRNHDGGRLCWYNTARSRRRENQLHKSFFILLLAALMGAIGASGLNTGWSRFRSGMSSASGICTGRLYWLTPAQNNLMNWRTCRSELKNRLGYHWPAGRDTSAIIAFKAMARPVAGERYFEHPPGICLYLFVVLSRFCEYVNEPLQKKLPW